MKYWFLAVISLAGSAAWADAREELNARLAAMEYLAADFTQQVQGSRGEVIEQSRGIVRLLRPQFRWEVIDPYPQVIVTEDGQLKIYDPDLEQVTVRPLGEALVDTPLALLTQDAVELGADYAIEQLSPNSFLLHPSGIDALFDEIVLDQAVACLHDLHDRVDHAQQHHDLDCALNREDVDVLSSVALEVPGSEVYVLRSDDFASQCRWRVIGRVLVDRE